jgi:hypothetical protein
MEGSDSTCAEVEMDLIQCKGGSAKHEEAGHWGPCTSADDEESQSGILSLSSSFMDLPTAILQIFESKDFRFGRRLWKPLEMNEKR